MARFRRRSRFEGDPGAQDDHEVPEVPEVPVPEAEESVNGTADASVEAGFDRADGPFDESEADQADQDLVRVDLGSLLIPGLPGVGVQVEADPNTQEVRAVTAVGDQAAVQLQAFAAPRSGGLWDEIRAEMIEELTGTPGAEVSLGVGSFGPEVRALLPARTPEGKAAQQPVRFIGIDGPRWFLRAVFLGRAAVEPEPGDALHRLVLQTIVVRGSDAMPPRDPLPLTLPADAVAAGEAEPGEQDEPEAEQDGFADLDPFERGPEITETR